MEADPAQTVWQCPSCGMNNPLSQITNCLNDKNCKFDLEAGEGDPIFCEMTQAELEAANNKWDLEIKEKKKKEEEEQANKTLKEDQWECEKCKAINTMNQLDRASATCKKCLRRNDIVYSLIKMSQDSRIKDQEKLEMSVYKRY